MNHQPRQCIHRQIHASSLKVGTRQSKSGIGKILIPNIDNAEGNANRQNQIKMQCDYVYFYRFFIAPTDRGISRRPSSQAFPTIPHACIEWPRRIVFARYRSGIRAIANFGGHGGCAPANAPGSGRHRPRAKKDARCTQRARIPVKEVSHELRVQIKDIARVGQRIDFDIDMTAMSGPRIRQARAAAPHAHAGTSRVEQ
ncbi:hypothetical protein [Burkholderia stagnalis]|uniref:hypothetical protein n=1 Tax=Burkholderia stagnalis TaxID=1503054 RepID=UPI000F80A5EA|nr:hypothetical protein [Burkholderia stagnalis]